MNEIKCSGEREAGRFDALHLLLTGMAGVLSIISSLAGVVFADKIYFTSALYNAFYPNDYLNLFLGIPALVLSVILALRGSRVGLGGWAACLLFILYNDIAYLFAVRNGFSLTVGGLLAAVCIAELVRLGVLLGHRQPKDGVPVRRTEVYGGILILMGLIFTVRGAVNIVGAVMSPGELSLPEIGVNIADVLICPLWIAGGLLLVRKRRFGWVAGMAVYLQGSLLFLALMIFLVLQPALCDTPFAAQDLLVIGVMALLFFIPCALLAKGTGRLK